MEKMRKERYKVGCAKIVQVIKVDGVKGWGVEDDSVRSIQQYWTLDGKLLVEIDTIKNKGGIK